MSLNQQPLLQLDHLDQGIRGYLELPNKEEHIWTY